MKKLIIIAITTLSASLGFGQSTLTLPANLKDTMVAMGQSFKTIGTQFSDSNLNESTAASTANLVLLTVHAQTMTPSKVLAMEPEDQPAMIEKYNSLMSKTSVIAVKILAAVQSGKNNEIPALLGELKAVRSTGHAEFIEE